MKREHFVQLGEVLGLTDKQIKGVFKRIERDTPKAMKWIDRSFLSEIMMNDYKAVLEERYKQLGIKE